MSFYNVPLFFCFVFLLGLYVELNVEKISPLSCLDTNFKG